MTRGSYTARDMAHAGHHCVVSPADSITAPYIRSRLVATVCLEVENLALNLDLKAWCPILELMPDSINLCVIHNSRSVPRGITHGRWLLARVWWTVLTLYGVLAVRSTRPFACKYICMHDYFVGVPAGSMLAESHPLRSPGPCPALALPPDAASSQEQQHEQCHHNTHKRTQGESTRVFCDFFWLCR